MNLNVHLEESKVTKETLKNQLEEKQCLEVEIVSLRKEAKKREETFTNHINERSQESLKKYLVNKKEDLKKKSSP